MKRREEIIDAGIEYTLRNRPMCMGGDAFFEEMREMNRNKSFEEGAKWADNNPKNDVYRDANGDVLSLEEIEKRYKQGVKHRKQKIIDKACEWIKNNKHLYKVLSFGSLSTDWDKFIREFRKAMEE